MNKMFFGMLLGWLGLMVVAPGALSQTIPSYPVLHQSSGVGIDAPVTGWVDYIVDDGEYNYNLWPQANTIGVVNEFGSHFRFAGGPSGAYSATWAAGGTTRTLKWFGQASWERNQ